MGRFSISELKTREQKIGVWISPDSICNTDLVNNLEKIGRIRFYETIERIIIQDVKDDQVLIEVWLSQMTFRKLFRVIFNLPYEVNRYTVFTCWQTSSLNWICEGDLGKGFPTEPQFYCVG